ncbi:MAG: hypothetical protein B7X76_08150 [Azorhizobium sp. 39-67-5]|nr:MAG: hypothetical protein B7X76_08150 [Azorhizobium sp. 39-67-5]
MFTRGNSNEVGKAIEAALSLAEARGDQVYQIHLMVGLSIFRTRIGDFQGALTAAQRSIPVAEASGTPGVIATAESVVGVAYHLAGDQIGALRHCERGLAIAEAAGAAHVGFFGYDHEVRALIALARCYWLTGFPDRAADFAKRVINLATERDHPVNLCMTLIFAATVFIWRGDFEEADQHVRRLLAHAARHSLGPYHTQGMALSGALAVARGNPAEGIAILKRSLEVLRVQKHHALTPALYLALAEGFLKAGHFDEAAATVDAGLALSEDFGEKLNVSELLRVRAEILLQATPPDPAAAERAFHLSLQQAREQSALGFELRSAMGLARHWYTRGELAMATDLLEGVHRRFVEGSQTKDLVCARELLARFAQ